MRATGALGVVAPVAALLAGIEAVVSIAARWPHQFGGHGSRDHMFSDFVSSGTVMAPPLIVLVIFVVAAALVRRADRWGSTACVVLVLLAALMIVGSLGEALAPPTPDVPRAVQLLSGAWDTGLGLLIATLAVSSLLERRNARGGTTSAWSRAPRAVD